MSSWIHEEFARAEARTAALPKWARPMVTRPMGSRPLPPKVRVTEDMIKRAVTAACEEAGWDWTSGPDADDPLIPSPESCMESVVRAAFDAAFGGEGGGNRG